MHGMTEQQGNERHLPICYPAVPVTDRSRGLIGPPNETSSRVIPSPPDDPLLLPLPWSDRYPAVAALRRGTSQVRQDLCEEPFDVLGPAGNKYSTGLNKQGQPRRTQLMARLPARVKSHPFIRGRLVGSHGAFMLPFYLQTHSIALPRSITLGARAGSLQAFGLSLKKSVTYSSRRCVQGGRRCVLRPLATTLSAVYIQRNSVFFIFGLRGNAIRVRQTCLW